MTTPTTLPLSLVERAPRTPGRLVPVDGLGHLFTSDAVELSRAGLDLSGVSRLVVRSGGPRDGVPAWTPAAWGVLEAAVVAIRSSVASVWLWPRAGDVVSDAPSARTAMRKLGAGLVLEPAAFFTPGMLPDAAEHLTRLFEALGESAEAVVLSNVVQEGEALREAALAQGALPQELVASLAARFVRSGVPRFVVV